MHMTMLVCKRCKCMCTYSFLFDRCICCLAVPAQPVEGRIYVSNEKGIPDLDCRVEADSVAVYLCPIYHILRHIPHLPPQYWIACGPSRCFCNPAVLHEVWFPSAEAAAGWTRSVDAQCKAALIGKAARAELLKDWQQVWALSRWTEDA